jgi:uncharacterized protein YrrD
MLYKATTLKDYTLHSLDGKIGGVKDFYFDDRHWTIRYLVADTGGWLTDRQVLISPYALASVNEKERSISINLTKQKIKDSPALDSDKPVSRQYEEAYHGYYGWPMYCGGPNPWGPYPTIERDLNKWRAAQGKKAWDPRLRSSRDVSGYHIQAKDGEVGHVDDFIIDDEIWAIRYLLINTMNWWPGKQVLVSPKWIERVSWGESKVFINLLRETIKRSPDYVKESPISRDYEARLHRHYDRPGYWTEDLAAKAQSR